METNKNPDTDIDIDSRIIKKFEDGSYLSFERGKFDSYQIFYTDPKNKSESLDNLKMLNKIKQLNQFNQINQNKNQINNQTNQFNQINTDIINQIYDIYRLDENSYVELDKIIDSINLEPRLYWQKLAYSITSLFFAQDNWSKKSNNFKRAILRDSIIRVLDGESPETVAKSYHGKSIEDIKEMLNINKRIDKNQVNDIESAWEE